MKQSMLMLTVHAIIFLLVITLKTHRTLDLDPEMQLMEGSSWRNDFVCVCQSTVCLQIYLSLHVYVSFLWLFSGCIPPVYTMSTLR